MTRVLLPGEPLVEGPTSLRPWRDSDVDALVACCQDPEISRWTRVPHPYRETDARVYLMQRDAAIHAGESAPFAVVATAGGRLLGSITLMRIAWDHDRAEVGYWLAAEARGQGHATRAVGLICAWGFTTLRLERIELIAAVGNEPSQRVAGRCGFHREAHLRSFLRHGHGYDDAFAYGLLAA